MILGAVRNIFLVLGSYLLGYFLAIPFGAILALVLDIGGSFLGSGFEYFMFGFPLGVTVLICFLFSIYGDRYKFWWVGLALVPVIWFQVQLAPVLVLGLLIAGGISWWLGTLANKALWKLAPGVMAKIG
ncbi:hypothetical protein HY414_01085 [Candidatus Kaiserbacteria bacterium]|nr:hypothetical protein [Candidatus Kaiserbacteria bacterium]